MLAESFSFNSYQNDLDGTTLKQNQKDRKRISQNDQILFGVYYFRMDFRFGVREYEDVL